VSNADAWDPRLGATLLDGPKCLYGVMCTECHGRPIEIRAGRKTNGALIVVFRCTQCGANVDAAELLLSS
jgi:hypothetical protein